MAPPLFDLFNFDARLPKAWTKAWGPWVDSIPQDARASKHFIAAYMDCSMKGYRMDDEGAKAIAEEVKRRTGPVYSFSR